MTFDEWYEENSERLGIHTFEYALREAWNAANPRFADLEKENSVLRYIIERDRNEHQNLKESISDELTEVLRRL